MAGTLNPEYPLGVPLSNTYYIVKTIVDVKIMAPVLILATKFKKSELSYPTSFYWNFVLILLLNAC